MAWQWKTAVRISSIKCDNDFPNVLIASSFYLVAKAIFPHHRPFNNHRAIDDYFVHLCRFPQCWNLHCTESSGLKLHRFQTPKSNKYSSGLDEDMLPVWRQIGDIIDSHISWLWKHFFASKIVLRVIWLFSIIFVASVPCLQIVVSFVRVIALSSSGHRWPFFVSSIPFDGCYVVGSFSMCLRVVRFSFRRRRYISSLELCISFNCCNCIIFKIWINHNTRSFSQHFHKYKMQLFVLFGLFTDRNERFLFPFIHLNWWNPYPSYTWSLKK